MRDYEEIQKDIKQKQKEMNVLIKEMEENGFYEEFCINTKDYNIVFPDIETGCDAITIIAKSLYYNDGQSYNGAENSIIVLDEYSEELIENIKDFFHAIEHDDFNKEENKKMKEEINDYIHSLSDELFIAIKNSLFMEHKQ